MTATIVLPSQFYIFDFKRATAFILLLIALPLLSEAQDGLVRINPIKIESDSILKTIRIEFNTPDVIANLLVRIEDSEGHTIFLDNKYNFSGSYIKSIDMKFQGKGVYSIEVTKDSKRIYRKIEMK